MASDDSICILREFFVLDAYTRHIHLIVIDFPEEQAEQ
jgi:hypothetical protein